MKKKSIPNNQKGAIALIFIILLVLVFFGFLTLGFDAGRWYAAKSKAQEACDAAVLAGIQAYGITNWKSLAEDVARENFPQGYLGFHRDTDGISIVGTVISGEPRVEGTIRVSAETYFGGFIGIDTAEVCVSCAAGRIPLEIMLVLDRSGSMQGQALTDVKTAAKSFVDNFAETQEVDKIGLITYATGVKVDFPLKNNFVADGIKTEIGNISLGTNPGDYDTNMEDALDQADDDEERNGDATTTFTKYAWDVPQSERAKQFLIFFTDGVPEAFRGLFTRNGITYDGVIPDPGDHSWDERRNDFLKLGELCPNLAPSDDQVVHNVGWLHDPYTGENIVNNHVDPDTGVKVFVRYGNGRVDFLPTGDGNSTEKTQCKWDCSGTNATYENTRWHVFGTEACPESIYNSEYGECEDDYPIDDYCDPDMCDVPYSGGLPPCCNSPYCKVSEWDLLASGYVLDTCKKMTKYHARKLKEQGIIIYCIGLGNVDSTLLKKIANTDDQYKKAPTDGDLTTIFNDIADAIKKQVHLL